MPRRRACRLLLPPPLLRPARHTAVACLWTAQVTCALRLHAASVLAPADRIRPQSVLANGGPSDLHGSAA